MVSYQGNNLTITKALLNVIADAKTKVYGDADPSLTAVQCQVALVDAIHTHVLACGAVQPTGQDRTGVATNDDGRAGIGGP